MKKSLVLLLLLSCACSQTTITLLTEAPPSRRADLDVIGHTLTVDRGLAVVLECSEYTEAYSGPCQDLDVEVDGDDAVDVFDAHLDAFSQRVSNYDDGEQLVAPADRKGVLLAAKEEGDAVVTFTAHGTPMSIDLVVTEPPASNEE